MRGTAFIGTSLDGFIAREGGEIDWLTGNPTTGEGEDYGYQAFFDTVDVLVMGRNSFDLVRSFPDWPYGEKPVVVLTSRPLEVPEPLRVTVRTMSGSPGEVAKRLEAEGAQHLYVDGGKTIQGFLAAGLIQKIIITRLPVLIGTGIPLFGPVPRDVHLRHVDTRSYPDGLVQSEYEVLRDN